MRTIAVTGSRSGIGAAAARMLREAGHKVIGVDLRDADINVDLSTVEGRCAAIEGVRRLADGELNGLIACAGVGSAGRNDRAILKVNYFGTADLLVSLRADLAQSHAPAAVVFASWAMLRPGRLDTVVQACLDFDEARALREIEGAPPSDDPRRVYATSKYALALLARRLAPAPQWAGQGITLNIIAPALIRTPMTAPFLATAAGMQAIMKDVPSPMPGIAEPEECADIAVYLASGAARRVTGQVFYVDGGLEALRRPDDTLQSLPLERWI